MNYVSLPLFESSVKTHLLKTSFSLWFYLFCLFLLIYLFIYLSICLISSQTLILLILIAFLVMVILPSYGVLGFGARKAALNKIYYYYYYKPCKWLCWLLYCSLCKLHILRRNSDMKWLNFRLQYCFTFALPSLPVNYSCLRTQTSTSRPPSYLTYKYSVAIWQLTGNNALVLCIFLYTNTVWTVSLVENQITFIVRKFMLLFIEPQELCQVLDIFIFKIFWLCFYDAQSH